MRRRQFALLGILLVVLGPAIYSLTRPDSPSTSDLTLVSGGYRLDKMYRSMEGPWSIQRDIRLQPADSEPRASTVWITGLEMQVVDAAKQNPVSPEFFCHSNLTFAEHTTASGGMNEQPTGKMQLGGRLFTLAPGRLSIELPPGFGVPVPADALLDYVTMSLNLNPRNEIVNVRMRTKLHAIAGDQPGAPTKALFRRALYVLQHEDNSGHLSCNAKSVIGQANAGAARASDHSGLGCGEWIKVTNPDGSSVLVPSAGMTNHWTVPTGYHVYTTDVTPQLNLPFDTTIHYATIHVHPFARGIELRDVTTGRTIFKLNSEDWPDRIGVAKVDEFKSIQGVPILRGHRYELTTEYDNTSGANTDAMAILYLYLLDKHA